MDWKGLVEKAKQIFQQRGGAQAAKEDAQELRDISKEQGSTADKAKDAAAAIREPGAHKPDAQAPAAGDAQAPAAGDAPSPAVGDAPSPAAGDAQQPAAGDAQPPVAGDVPAQTAGDPQSQTAGDAPQPS